MHAQQCLPGSDLGHRIRGRFGVAVVDQVQHRIGIRDGGAGAVHADALHLVGAGPEPRGVRQAHGEPVDVQGFVQGVPGRARNVGDDGGIPAAQAIHQGRLAHVGGAGNDHAEAVSKHASLPRVGEGRGDGGAQGLEATHELRFGEKVDLLLGKVDRRFHVRADVHQLIDVPAQPLRKGALERTHRAPGRLLGSTLDQVGDRLRLGQVEPPVQEGALAELSGPRHPRPGAQRAVEHHAGHHRPAVSLQLDGVFPGIGTGSGLVQREPPVHALALRVAKGAKARGVGRRQAPDHAPRNPARLRAGKANDPDPAPPRRRGHRRDRVAPLQHRGPIRRAPSSAGRGLVPTGLGRSRGRRGHGRPFTAHRRATARSFRQARGRRDSSPLRTIRARVHSAALSSWGPRSCG